MRRATYHLEAKPAAALARAAGVVASGLLIVQSAVSQTTCARKPRIPLPRPSYNSFFGRQLPVTGSSPDWRIDLIRRQNSARCTYGSAFLFSVRNERSGSASQRAVCSKAEQVDEIGLVSGSRAIILGRAGANFSTADILELPGGKLLDEFDCFMPAVSPSRRFLAFLKSFPGHPGPVAVNAEYLVYDLAQSPAYNREHLKPGVTYEAGWPVYPPGSTNAAGENLKPGLDTPVHWISSDRLFWLDRWTLAFSDFYPGRDRLVVVDLRKGIRNPGVRTLDLDASEIVDFGHCRRLVAASDFKAVSKDPAGAIRVSRIEKVPGETGELCLHVGPIFLPQGCLRRSDLMVRLPDVGRSGRRTTVKIGDSLR